MTELRKLFIEGEVSGETVKVTNGGLDVNIQDQTTRPLDLRFIQATGTATTTNGVAVVDAVTLTLTDATGFSAGAYIALLDGAGGFFFATQIGAPAGNVITLDTPIDQAYVSGATVLETSFAMNVNGSSTTQVFQIGPVGSTIVVDITRVNGYIQDGSAMDDSLFGAISALTNGIVLRRSDGSIENLWNAKTNGDLALLSGVDFTYTEAAPSGSTGARFRITYAGASKHGVTVRLSDGEILELLVQDDLTGLEAFNMMAQGHVVE